MACSSSSLLMPPSLLILVMEKLIRDNFCLWRVQVLLAIQSAQLEDYIDGLTSALAKTVPAEKDPTQLEPSAIDPGLPALPVDQVTTQPAPASTPGLSPVPSGGSPALLLGRISASAPGLFVPLPTGAVAVDRSAGPPEAATVATQVTALACSRATAVQHAPRPSVGAKEQRQADNNGAQLLLARRRKGGVAVPLLQGVPLTETALPPLRLFQRARACLRSGGARGLHFRCASSPSSSSTPPPVQQEDTADYDDIAMVLVFALGYAGIIFEETLAFNKSGVGLLMAVCLWVIRSIGAPTTDVALQELSHTTGEVSEIVFFLLGAMTIVEIVDAHQGFKLVTDNISTRNSKTLLWVVSY
ncbi:hypothetical protein PR202_gb29269 [Eleusine coracana subsp. coracana]|uniref:Uncharacterized protein n=1 Tax=Eleusine coracana subsp. coracana TaxID=191504 RepID=A0AAV5FZK4_ELECO|nr:hypothetical protein PR202_gb29269 [Eleusine coracana subsp. coracana]